MSGGLVGELYSMDVGLLQQSFEFLFGLRKHVEAICRPIFQRFHSGHAVPSLVIAVRAFVCNILLPDLESLY